MSKIIFHIIPHGPGLNVGNFAISQAIKYMIKEINPEVNILTIDAMNSNKSGFNGLNKKTIYEANQYASGIIIGGGNLYENNELFVDENALESLEVPLLIFSLSVGKIYNKQYKLVRRSDVMPDSKIINLNKKSYASLSRDLATKKYLDKIGLKKNILGLCPTIFLDDYFENNKINKNLGKEDFLIVVRNPDQMSIPYEKRHEVSQFVKKIYLKFKNEGKKIKILCNDIRDITFVNSLGISDYIYTNDVNEYLSRIKNSSLIISFRIHASLPAISFGKKLINFSYDERGESLISSIGFGSWDIKIIKEKNWWKIFNIRIKNFNFFEKLSEKSKLKCKKFKNIQLAALKKIL